MSRKIQRTAERCRWWSPF